MHSVLKHLILVSFVTACGSSGGGGDSPAPNNQEQKQESDSSRPIISQIPSGEVEVFKLSEKPAFSKANVRCTNSGYGYTLDEILNQISVCCVAMDKVASDGSKFVSRQADKIVIKPTQCEAAVLSGMVPESSLPIEVDLTSQRYVAVGYDVYAGNFQKVTGEVTILGSDKLDTKLMGSKALTLNGKATISNIHAMGTEIVYALHDTAGFNSLAMKHISIEGYNSQAGGLTLSTNAASTRATTGMSLKFDSVKVVAERKNPVLLLNYPFDTSGIEIVAGKKYAPHIGFVGVYSDTTGQLTEKRYPVLPEVSMAANSKLAIGPGVTLKLPSIKELKAGFKSNNDSGTFELSLNGGEAEHIRLANAQDDTVGGDTNGDGNTTNGSLSQLLDSGFDGSASSHGDIRLHYVDLVGVGLQAQFDARLFLGNLTIRPAQNGTSLTYGIGMSATRTAKIAIDAPIEAWHPIETYNSQGKLKLGSLVYTGARGNYTGQSGDAFVEGVDLIKIHNTSTSPNKIGDDIRVVGADASICNRIQDKSGQISADAKKWSYYVTDSALTQCQ